MLVVVVLKQALNKYFGFIPNSPVLATVLLKSRLSKCVKYFHLLCIKLEVETMTQEILVTSFYFSVSFSF